MISVYANNLRMSRSNCLLLKPYGLAHKNMYVPMFAYFTGTVFKKDNEKRLIYQPVINFNVLGETGERRQIIDRSLFTHVINGSHTKVFVNNQIYYTHKGCVYQFDPVTFKVKFLMVLAIESEHFMENMKLHSLLDYNKLMLFVHHDVNLPEHNSLKRRILNYASTNLEGVNIMYTNDIEHWCFNNNLKNIKFSSIIDRMKFIENIKLMSYGKEKAPEQQPEQQPETTTGQRLTLNYEGTNYSYIQYPGSQSTVWVAENQLTTTSFYAGNYTGLSGAS